MQTLTIIRPDDMHLHVRSGAALQAVTPFSAKQMGRAVIMPNLKPPVATVAQALAYKAEIINALPKNSAFTPLMTLYLTDKTTPDTVFDAAKNGIVAFKLYPAGATTNSDDGVTDLFRLHDTLQAMSDACLPLLMHGEVVDNSVDIFDREAVFIEKIAKPLCEKYPNLRMVFEHITTHQAAEFVSQANENIVATITPQHLLMNRNHLLVGGVRPHHYCLPILKRETHRQALLQAVSGSLSHKFFLGTDSAPHAQNRKECACGCAGVFSAHAAIELYAEAFEEANALSKLQAFASQNGAKFYRLPENTDTITLVKQPQQVPDFYAFGEEKLVPLRAGETIAWRVVDE